MSIAEILKGTGVSAFEKFCEDCILVSPHAILTAVPREKIISVTGAVPTATAFSFSKTFKFRILVTFKVLKKNSQFSRNLNFLRPWLKKKQPF